MTDTLTSRIGPFERGRRSALDQLDLLAHDHIESRASAAWALLDAMDNEKPEAADYRLDFVRGWRQVLLDAISDAAAYRFDVYHDEHPTDRSSAEYVRLRDASFKAKDAADEITRHTTPTAVTR